MTHTIEEFEKFEVSLHDKMASCLFNNKTIFLMGANLEV